jgi:hypothetical protein
MPLELIEEPRDDPRNALFLATAADLAYMPAAEGVAAFREQLGLEAQLISVSNTQVYVGSNDAHIVAAFRGSESPTSLDGLRDWLLTNAVNFLILPEGEIGTDFAAAGVNCKFHKGFMAALADIWDPFLKAVEAELEKKERPLWVTGHSLGGALAVLACWRLQRKFIAVHQVITFGAPMVGNGPACKAIDGVFTGRILRYVNGEDVVPRLPTVSLLANEYGHCEKEMCVGAAATSLGSFLSGLAGQAVDGLLTVSLKESLWKYLNEKMSFHDIVNYRKLLGK